MNNKTLLEIEYISKKYDESNIPLYISYPTLSWWKGNTDEHTFIENIKKATEPFLYFHFPYCKKECFYCMCYRIVSTRENDIDIYLDYLEKEIEQKISFMGNNKLKISQMHWGGGTPTYLTIKQLERVYAIIEKNFSIIKNGESNISIESYPDDTVMNEDKLKLLKILGFNEISFGVQDFDERVQNAINRINKPEVLEFYMSKAKELGLRTHVDLCYGLPFQELGGFEKTIRQVIEMQPDRVAMLTYVHYPTLYPKQRLIPVSSIPNSFMRILLSNLAEDLFTSSGYVKVGFDHYVKRDNNLHKAFIEKKVNRDLMGYSTDGRRQFIGFGNSAISFLGQSYYHNKSSLKEYYRSIDEDTLPLETTLSHTLTKDDEIRNSIIQKEILTYFKIDKERISNQYGINFDDYFNDEMKRCLKFKEDNLIEYEDKNKINIVKQGRFVARHIAHAFDKYYN